MVSVGHPLNPRSPRPNRIVLLTDFGEQDGYVGIMKGVIAQTAPNCPVIDLSHRIPPQDIGAGRFCLANAYRYFPQGSIFVAVVDPGVGSDRRSIAVEFAQGYFVGPDNGLISGILENSPARRAIHLTNRHYWRIPQPSFTFQGRDIFASVAAHLAQGVPFTDLGETLPVEDLVTFPLLSVVIMPQTVQGCLQYIDQFGNLISNIPVSCLTDAPWSVQFKHQQIPGGQSYHQVPIGTAIALGGSHGWLEIAINQGHAQQQFAAQVGDELTVYFDKL
ncbi:MAG: S-adenosyl-l-methionine hydroxide adenosyltransferase family protein [Microcystaceae cyanobacterium]